MRERKVLAILLAAAMLASCGKQNIEESPSSETAANEPSVSIMDVGEGTYSELEERNVSNISVINLFYQSFLAQNDVAENTYTIIAGDTNLFSMDKYAKKAGGNPIRYILTNDIPQLDTLGQSHKIIDTIDVNPENMSVFDKLTAKEIINLIKNDDKAGKYDTIATILHKCKTFSKMPNHQTLFILHSLIHGGYLKREVKSVDEDKNKTTIVLGDETKLEQLLSKLD